MAWCTFAFAHGSSPISGRGAAVDKLPRGERTGRGGVGLVHSAFAHSDSAHKRHCSALREGASAFAFALPHPAHGASPISGRGRGGRQVAAGRAHGQGRGLPCALPPLRTVIRHTSGRGRGRRQVAAGRAHGQGRGLPGALPPLHTVIRHTSGMFGTARGGVRLCLRPPPPCARRCGTRCHNGADTPRERPTGERYIIIRVRRREGENVLHRAAGNDVDNFSVDNALWITAAAGGRLLRGGRRRLCGGSVNADGGSVNAGSLFRPHGCDFTARTGRTYI